MNVKPETTEAAFHALAVWAERREAYHRMTNALRDLQGDFPSSVSEVDTKLADAVISLLDMLFDDMASYFLFECSGDGAVHIGDKVWPIQSIDDIRTYLKESPHA